MARRDYTNGQGYVCPTENEAIRRLDRRETALLKMARQLYNVLTNIAQMMDYRIVAIEIKARDEDCRYYKTEGMTTLERR